MLNSILFGSLISIKTPLRPSNAGQKGTGAARAPKFASTSAPIDDDQVEVPQGSDSEQKIICVIL